MATSVSLNTELFGTGTDLFTGELELMGTWEVARYLGTERSRPARWLDELEKGKASIAAPVARLKSGPFWQFAQIRVKAQEMYRTAGAPHGPQGLDTWLAERREHRARRDSAPAQRPAAAAV